MKYRVLLVCLFVSSWFVYLMCFFGATVFAEYLGFIEKSRPTFLGVVVASAPYFSRLITKRYADIRSIDVDLRLFDALFFSMLAAGFLILILFFVLRYS